MKMQGTAAAAIALGILSLAASGCGDSAPPAATPADPAAVVARFAGGEIMRGEIQQAIANNLAGVPQPAPPETLRAIVRKIVERRVRTRMLLAEALAKGYDQRPEVKIRQAAAEDRVLAEDLLEKETAAAKAADAVVVAELDRRLADASSEETRKFSHIYLRAPESDGAARKAAAELMAKIQQELAAGASFNELAERHSTSVMARGGGRIDWTLRKKMQRAAGDAVFALAKEGDLSPLVSTGDGLHLFRLDGIRRPAPIDAAATRAAVRQELDAEARNAAVRARRQLAFDAHAAELAPAGRLSRLEQALREETPAAAGAEWVARWKGGELSETELAALHGRVLAARQPLEVELRWLVENRLLAAERRQQGLTPEMEARLADARQGAVIDSYRGDLMEQLDTPPSEEEIVRYHRDNAASSLALRDFQVDALFFPQQGEQVAETYAAGEEVVTALRGGAPFDQLLDRPARPDAKVCRAVHGLDLEELGKSSLRLRKTLVNMGDGEISPALYLERPVALSPDCTLGERGIVFVRLRGIGTVPLDRARPAILAALSKERVEKGITVIQERLIAESKLEILLPEG